MVIGHFDSLGNVTLARPPQNTPKKYVFKIYQPVGDISKDELLTLSELYKRTKNVFGSPKIIKMIPLKLSSNCGISWFFQKILKKKHLFSSTLGAEISELVGPIAKCFETFVVRYKKYVPANLYENPLTLGPPNLTIPPDHFQAKNQCRVDWLQRIPSYRKYFRN